MKTPVNTGGAPSKGKGVGLFCGNRAASVAPPPAKKPKRLVNGRKLSTVNEKLFKLTKRKGKPKAKSMPKPQVRSSSPPAPRRNQP